MFNGMQMVAVSTDVNLATQALTEENSYRFRAFSADDAITLVCATVFQNAYNPKTALDCRAFLSVNAFVLLLDTQRAKG
jgi:hypothetical protein